MICNNPLYVEQTIESSCVRYTSPVFGVICFSYTFFVLQL